ncbi:hypothetical protein BC828DRAFT_155018 [Blastocladiella britannica]|nr:hypothetical protein BC828DRAFT_155018 [Blastocladiella britannica]
MMVAGGANDAGPASVAIDADAMSPAVVPERERRVMESASAHSLRYRRSRFEDESDDHLSPDVPRITRRGVSRATSACWFCDSERHCP